jgi:hypothetical protein
MRITNRAWSHRQNSFSNILEMNIFSWIRQLNDQTIVLNWQLYIANILFNSFFGSSRCSLKQVRMFSVFPILTFMWVPYVTRLEPCVIQLFLLYFFCSFINIFIHSNLTPRNQHEPCKGEIFNFIDFSNSSLSDLRLG